MSTATAPLDHPSWCSPDHCMMNEPEHRVHLVRLIQFQPIEGYPRSGQPFVDLTLQYPDDGPEHPAEDLSLCFDSELARAVGQILLTAGRQGSR